MAILDISDFSREEWVSLKSGDGEESCCMHEIKKIGMNGREIVKIDGDIGMWWVWKNDLERESGLRVG